MEADKISQETPMVQAHLENEPIHNNFLNQKGNFLLILGAVVIILVLLGAGGYLLTMNKNSNHNQNAPQPTPTSNSAVSSPMLEPITIPEENTLYLGTYNNEDAIFITDKEKQNYFDPGAVPKTSSDIGELQISGGGGRAPFDFKKLTNPRKIFSSNTQIKGVNSFLLNKAKSIAYVILNYGNEVNGSYPGVTNKIIQIKLDTLSVNEKWSNEVGSKKYESAGGPAYMDTIADDNYITFQLYNCYACEGSPVGTVILNLITKKEKYYKDIGNIQFNIINNTFSYQKLAPIQEPCGEPSPYCGDNGQSTVYKPSGQAFTENLP